MKKKLSSILTSVALVLSCGISGVTAQAANTDQYLTIFEEDFESPSNSWDTNGDYVKLARGVLSCADIPANTDKDEEGQATGKENRATLTLPTVISRGAVVYEMKFKYYNSKGVNFTIQDTTGGQGQLMIIGADESNNQRLMVLDSAGELTSIVENTNIGAEPGDDNWHTLKLAIDMDTKAMEVFYDGASAINTSYALNDIAKLKFVFPDGKSGAIMIDDIKISTDAVVENFDGQGMFWNLGQSIYHRDGVLSATALGANSTAVATLPAAISDGSIEYEMRFKYYDSKGINLTLQDTADGQGSLIIIGADNSNNQRVLITNSAQNGYEKVIQTDATAGAEPGNDTWHKLKLAIDMDTKAINVYYDDDLKANTGYNKANLAKLSFQFNGGKPGTIAIDDIKISKDGTEVYGEDFESTLNISSFAIKGTSVKYEAGELVSANAVSGDTASSTLPYVISTGKVAYEMKFKYYDSKGINLTLQDANGNQGQFMIIGADNSNKQRVLVLDKNGATTEVVQNTTTGAEPGDDKWHTLKLIINMNTKAMEVFYDDVSKVDTVYNKDNLAKLNFAFNGGKPGTIAINDVKLYSLENAATGVHIDGAYKVGNTLTGRYSWGTGDETFVWLVSDTKDGEYTVIEGATTNTLEITEALIDKCIKFGVTADGVTTYSNYAKKFVIDNASLDKTSGAKAVANIENFSCESRSCVLIVAAYDNKGAFVEAKIMPVTIEADETKAVETEAVTGGVTYKGFVWDSFNNAIPLTNVLE